MKIRFYILLAFCSISVLTACRDTTAIYQNKLNNGMTLILNQKSETEIVSVILLVRAGAILDTEETQGLAKEVQTCLFHETDSNEDVQLTINSLAAKYFTGLHPDFVYFGITASSNYLPNIFSIVKDVVFYSSFSDSLVLAKKYQLQQELEQANNNPRKKMAMMFREALFTDHPYRFSGLGSGKTISAITTGDVQHFHERYYIPSNMTVIVTGHFDHNSVRRSLEGMLDVGDDVRPPVKTWKPQWRQNEIHSSVATHHYGPDIAFVSLGWNAPCIQNKDTYVMDILLGCIGIGESSRLNVQVRDKIPGVYYTWAEYTTTREPGYFVMNAICHPDRVQEVKNAFLKEIAIIQTDSVTPKELARTKQYFKSLEAYQNEDVINASFSIGYWAALSDYSFSQSYLSKLNEVTLDDLKKASKQYFNLNAYTWCALVPGTKEKGQPQ